MSTIDPRSNALAFRARAMANGKISGGKPNPARLQPTPLIDDTNTTIQEKQLRFDAMRQVRPLTVQEHVHIIKSVTSQNPRGAINTVASSLTGGSLL